MSVKSRKGVQPEYLLSTNGSAWQHSLRVYLQIEYWKTLLATDIDPLEWGWQMKNEVLEPVMTLQVSFSSILNVAQTKQFMLVEGYKVEIILFGCVNHDLLIALFIIFNRPQLQMTS